MTPTVGLTTAPMIPLPKPLKRPSIPSSFAPLIGSSMIPATPFTRPNLEKNKKDVSRKIHYKIFQETFLKKISPQKIRTNSH